MGFGYFKLGMVGLVPVIVSVILYIIDDKYLKNVSRMTKQIIYGVIFGFIAILGTEKGIEISGAMMNVRDSAPLCAGLIFGAPAGIIAGLIGGIERWFAVYWGVGTYTRVACTVGTILSGFFGALLRKYVFNDHVPKPIYAYVAGLVAEVVHMMLLFVTHSNDEINAFNIVKLCAVPMIVANVLATGIAVTLVYLIIRNKNKAEEKQKMTISQNFQRRLLIVVIVAFIFTNAFSFLLQSSISKTSIKELLTLNIEDIKGAAVTASDTSLLEITEDIASIIDASENVNEDLLKYLCTVYEVTEINIANLSGIIKITTNPRYKDFDMSTGDQATEFLQLLHGKPNYVQEMAEFSYDDISYMKYAGVALKRGGFVQVGYNLDAFYKDLRSEVKGLALNRHVGESGLITITDLNGRILSNYTGEIKGTLKTIGLADDFSKMDETKIHRAEIEGIDSFYMFTIAEGYIVVASQPTEEALFNPTMSIYLTTFMEIIVFAAIFILIFFAIDGIVVKNIKDINGSLKKITDGDLETVVDVRQNREFDSLSNGINSTVDRLKKLISEAEQRMKNELEYAAEIQRSALPSTFPAFPDRNDIDIYADMDPAKEVGGDFYDFYFIDSNKLAILIADVSGKGVPASLFMMRAKTIIKSYAEYGIAINDVFTNVNFNLCEGNETGLFVTAWMGVIDLETGHMTFANAGHNPPLIKKPNGNYEYLRTKPGFVLGGMEGVVYKLHEIDLEPGSEIFIYTDGLTEAHNSEKELYGEERLEQSINNYEFQSSVMTCKHVKEDVDKFVGDAEQFDDLTMLHLKFIKKTFD